MFKFSSKFWKQNNYNLHLTKLYTITTYYTFNIIICDILKQLSGKMWEWVVFNFTEVFLRNQTHHNQVHITVDNCVI